MKARFQKFFKSRLVQAVLIAVFFLAVGIFLGLNSWNKTVYVQLKPGGKGRYVASAGKTEIVSLSLEEYREQIQKKIFGHTKVMESEGVQDIFPWQLSCSGRGGASTGLSGLFLFGNEIYSLRFIPQRIGGGNGDSGPLPDRG